MPEASTANGKFIPQTKHQSERIVPLRPDVSNLKFLAEETNSKWLLYVRVSQRHLYTFPRLINHSFWRAAASASGIAQKW